MWGFNMSVNMKKIVGFLNIATLIVTIGAVAPSVAKAQVGAAVRTAEAASALAKTAEGRGILASLAEVNAGGSTVGSTLGFTSSSILTDPVAAQKFLDNLNSSSDPAIARIRDAFAPQLANAANVNLSNPSVLTGVRAQMASVVEGLGDFAVSGSPRTSGSSGYKTKRSVGARVEAEAQISEVSSSIESARELMLAKGNTGLSTAEIQSAFNSGVFDAGVMDCATTWAQQPADLAISAVADTSGLTPWERTEISANRLASALGITPVEAKDRLCKLSGVGASCNVYKQSAFVCKN